MKKPTRRLEQLLELSEIDRTVHEPARLAILMYLHEVEKADSVFLFNATKLTWGNLSSHVARLEEAGYVTVEKGFVGKKPRTIVGLTKSGKKALDDYLSTMRAALGS